MKNQLKLIGIDLEKVIEIAFNNCCDRDGNQLDGKQVIKDLFARRNEIAHQSDRNHYNAEKNDITKEYVLDNIEYVKRIVLSIHNMAISKAAD